MAREVSVKIGYEVDQASVRKAQASADAVETSLVETQRATQRAADTARTATDQYEAFGRTSGRLAQLAGALGAGPAAEVLGFGADLADTMEDLAPKFAGVGSMAQAAIPALAGMEAGAAGMVAVLGPIAAVAAAAAVAIALVSSELDKQAEAARNYIARVQEINAFLSSGGTSEAAQAAMETAQQEADAAARDIANFGPLLREGIRAAFGDTFLGMDVATVPITELARQVQNLSAITYAASPQALEYATAITNATVAQRDALQDIAGYGQAILEGETAANDATAAAEELAAAEDEAVNSLEGIAGALGRVNPDLEKLNREMEATRTAAEAAAAADAERKEAIIDAARQFAEDEARIQEQGAEALAAIEQQYADARVDIAQRAAEESRAALARLQQQESDLARDFGRDTAQADREARAAVLQEQIDYQREDARAARTHADDLLRIRRQSQDREAELLLASDFRGLYLLRRDRSRQMDESERTYGRERQERLTALQEQAADRQAAFIAERGERVLQYQQAVEDARAAYRQQASEAARQQAAALAQAAQAHRQGIAEQSAALQAELATRRAAATAELQMLSMTEQQRLAIQAQANQQYLALANQLLSGMSVMTAKAAMSVPSSVVTNANRSATFNNQFNIKSGADASTVASAVDRQLVMRMNQVMGKG